MASQPPTPAASYTHSDTFQQPFASDTPQSQGSQAEAAHSAPQQDVTSAFADDAFTTSTTADTPRNVMTPFADPALVTAQQPQHAAGIKTETGGERKLEKPESARKLQEAGKQPLPHSAFAAEHKQEPTAFAIPEATELEVLPSGVPDVAQQQQQQQQQQRGFNLSTQGKSAVPHVQDHGNFDFTDLNPLPPKTVQQPTSAKSQRDAAPSNPFDDTFPEQQPSGATAEQFSDDDLAEPGLSVQQPVTSAAPLSVPTQPLLAQEQTYEPEQQRQPAAVSASMQPAGEQEPPFASQQRQSGTPVAETYPIAAQQQSRVLDQGQPTSAKGQTPPVLTEQPYATEQQQSGFQTTASEQQQPGSARSQASISNAATGLQPGLAKSQAREQTFAPELQQSGLATALGPQTFAPEQQQPGSAKSQASTAGGVTGQQPGAARSQAGASGASLNQATGKREDLFVKPTAFDEAVDSGTRGSTTAAKGVDKHRCINAMIRACCLWQYAQTRTLLCSSASHLCLAHDCA